MTRLRTHAEIMALPDLSKAERQLLNDCPKGEPTVLGTEAPSEPTDENRIRAEILRYLILGGCDACCPDERGVRLEGAYVIGELDLSFCAARGATVLLYCHFAEPIEAIKAQFNLLILSGSKISALNASGARVAGDLFLRRICATGQVRLAGAEIGGQLACDGGRFGNEDEEAVALTAQSARVAGAVFLRDGFAATAEVSLAGAQIGGCLDCTGGSFRSVGRDALNVQGARIAGSVLLSGGFSASGEVRLAEVEIGEVFSCIGGSFENPGGRALNAEGARVASAVFLCDNFTSNGEVSLHGAEIGGQLACQGGRFENVGGYALNAQRMHVVRGFFWRGVTVAAGVVELSSAHVGDLVDSLDSWPEWQADVGKRLCLDGFVYERISGAFTDAGQRLEWLSRGDHFKGVFYPQPYEHLAKVLGEMGHAESRRQVLMARERLQRKSDRRALVGKPPWRFVRALGLRVADLFLRGVVGYGYKPWRSIWTTAALIAVGWITASLAWTTGTFAPNSDVIVNSTEWQTLARDFTILNPAEVWSTKRDPAALLAAMPLHCPDLSRPECIQGQGMDYEAFHPFFYAFDVVVPLVSLGQEATWAPSKDRGTWGWTLWWLRWVLAISGWVVTGFGAAAVTGLIRRD